MHMHRPQVWHRVNAGVHAHLDACVGYVHAYVKARLCMHDDGQSSWVLVTHLFCGQTACTVFACLQQVPLAHPFANLDGSDNIISFKTQRYNEQPLTIRGPGAGAEVTAAGVFGDLLHVIKMLGMP